MQKENLEFGSGSFVGAAMNDPAFHELSILEQARVVGWADGCPVVTELTDPENTDPGRGPEAMLNRYGSVNFWFGFIARAAGDHSPDLYDQIMTEVDRLPDEPVGKYEPESVPFAYLFEMAPMGTLAGYALPRIFTKQLGENLSKEDSQARLIEGLAVLDKAIPQAETPLQLLALVAEGLAEANVPATTALSSVLSPGWFEEHNSINMLNDAEQALEADAPKLWAVYTNLSTEEKAQYKIL